MPENTLSMPDIEAMSVARFYGYLPEQVETMAMPTFSRRQELMFLINHQNEPSAPSNKDTELQPGEVPYRGPNHDG